MTTLATKRERGRKIMCLAKQLYDCCSDPHTNLVDLLADLMHWTDTYKYGDFDAALRTATDHYEAEVKGEY